VENHPQAVARLREQPSSAVALDPFHLENEPEESDQVPEHLDTAALVARPCPGKDPYDRTMGSDNLARDMRLKAERDRIGGSRQL
jgi:hypothetical protein